MNNNKPLGVITVVSGELKGTQYYVADGQTMVIGRSKDSEIVMPHSYSHVSRHHCIIAYDGINRNFYVVDTSSTGVYNSTGHHLKLQGYVGDGTILWIGNQDCMIQLSIVTDYQVDNSVPDDIKADRFSASSQYARGNSNYIGSSRGRHRGSEGRRLKKDNKTLTVSVIMIAVIIVAGISIGLIYKLNSSVSEFEVAAAKPTGDLLRRDDDFKVNELAEEERDKRDEQAREQEEKWRDEQETPREEQKVADRELADCYYYSVLSGEEKEIYECIEKLVQNPNDENNVVAFESSINTNSEEFIKRYFRAYDSFIYDHTETFWLYCGNKADIWFECYGNTLYLSLTNTYPEYSTEKAAFDKAVDEFMDGIDLAKSDAEIALQIHDNLIDLVTYDFDECDKGEDILAHTAYGALVKNGKGMDNYAVCDGYSQAYVYLLRQAGIQATVIVGDAGNSESDAGGHAWNVVCLDGEWYEVDSTWDDCENNEIALEKEFGKEAKGELSEVFEDNEYRDKMEHYLYNITTDEITDYTPDNDYYTYTFENGDTYIFISHSIHHRWLDENKWGRDALIMQIAPIAEGTKYRYH